MSLSVLPNYPRGELILDPDYYTSSIFVDPLRNDIQNLLAEFKNKYSSAVALKYVFSLFKEVWKANGWEYLHLSEISDVSRDTFLVTVFRLFIERLTEKEESLIRAGALFGLYSAFSSQPTSRVRVQQQILIPMDIYVSLPELFASLPMDVSHYVTFVLSRLFEQHSFLILPASTLSPYNPCNLPHSILKEKGSSQERKKAGRKSKKEKAQIAWDKIKSLEQIVDTPPAADSTLDELAAEYTALKQKMKDLVPIETIRKAEALTADRLRTIDSEMENSAVDSGRREGLERIESVLQRGGSLLNLTKGSAGSS